MKQNEHQLGEVKKYCKEVGVDKLVFKTMQISSYENALKFLPTNKKFRRYALDDQSFRIKNEIKNHCFALWRTSVITGMEELFPAALIKMLRMKSDWLTGNHFLKYGDQQSIIISEKNT